MVEFRSLYNVHGVTISVETNSHRFHQETLHFLWGHTAEVQEKVEFYITFEEIDSEPNTQVAGDSLSTSYFYQVKESDDKILIKTSDGSAVIDIPNKKVHGLLSRPSRTKRYETNSVSMAHLIILQIMVLKKYLPIHASGITQGNKAILFSGSAGSGKSTLALNLHKSGFPIISDDLIYLAMGRHGIVAGGHCQPAKLFNDTFDPFFEPWEFTPSNAVIKHKRLIDTAKLNPNVSDHLYPVEVFVFLEKSVKQRICFQPIHGTDMISRLMKSCTMDNAAVRKLALDFLPAMSAVSFFEVRSGDSPEKLCEEFAFQLKQNGTLKTNR